MKGGGGHQNRITSKGVEGCAHLEVPVRGEEPLPTAFEGIDVRVFSIIPEDSPLCCLQELAQNTLYGRRYKVNAG